MKIVKINVLIVFCMIIVSCDETSAGEYVSLDIKITDRSTKQKIYLPPADPTVCDAYRKNLNSANNQTHPMTCYRLVNAGFAGVFPIKWIPINDALAVKMLSMVSDPDIFNRPQSTRDKIIIENNYRSIREKNIVVEQANFDFNNDGTEDWVLRKRYMISEPPLGCVQGEYSQSNNHIRYLIFDFNGKYLASTSKVANGLSSAGPADVFRYQNKTYFDMWERDYEKGGERLKSPEWMLRLYEVAGNVKYTICEYQYIK